MLMKQIRYYEVIVFSIVLIITLLLGKLNCHLIEKIDPIK